MILLKNIILFPQCKKQDLIIQDLLHKPRAQVHYVAKIETESSNGPCSESKS